MIFQKQKKNTFEDLCRVAYFPSYMDHLQSIIFVLYQEGADICS